MLIKKTQNDKVRVIFTVVTLVVVAVMIILSVQPVKISLLEEGLKIQGLYGEVYAWDDIAKVELVEKLPKIESRTNGSSIGTFKRGHFRTTELGSVKMFVDASKPPFIIIYTQDKPAIFNMKTPEETKAMFDEIQKRVK